jgi:hypothetical protein
MPIVMAAPREGLGMGWVLRGAEHLRFLPAARDTVTFDVGKCGPPAALSEKRGPCAGLHGPSRRHGGDRQRDPAELASLDGRYFGPIPSAAIAGLAGPLWTPRRTDHAASTPPMRRISPSRQPCQTGSGRPLWSCSRAAPLLRPSIVMTGPARQTVCPSSARIGLSSGTPRGR